MPATALTVTTTAASGTVYPANTAVDQPNGNSVVNTGRELVIVTNGAASPITVTFITQANYVVNSINYAVADNAQTVTNGTSKIFGPFDRNLYNDTNGLLQITWSSGTTITANAISMGTA